MRYSVCIIDNDIPAAGSQAQTSGIKDSELLNASNLQLLLSQETWTDEVIKNLTKTLLDQKDTDGISSKWEVYGFTNPSFYINSIDNGFFRSDLVVFDWEYPGAAAGSGTDSESILKEIMDRTFSLVFIFSKADKKTEIDAILAKPEFQEYKERLSYLDKTVGGVDQTNTLLQKAEEMYANNFSFRFASELRKKSVQIMDKILSELGRATLSDVKNYLKLEEGSEKRDMVDFIAERFRAGLVTAKIPDLEPEEIGRTNPAIQPPDNSEEIGVLQGEISERKEKIKTLTGTSSTQNHDPELIKKIWAYRLYLPIDGTINPGDELVRRGDIVKWSDKHFLVVSADCDLKRFWHKNFGSISLLPLHPLNNSNSELREVLTFCVSPGDLKQSNFKHLTDNIGKLSEGPFILPFLKTGNTYGNFVVMPKEFTGRQINIHTEVTALSKDKRKNAQLKYSWWEGAEKICSVSEPFLAAVIQHTFAVIGGYGVPDYPNPAMKNIFENILNDFVTVPATAAVTPAVVPVEEQTL